MDVAHDRDGKSVDLAADPDDMTLAFFALVVLSRVLTALLKVDRSSCLIMGVVSYMEATHETLLTINSNIEIVPICLNLLGDTHTCIGNFNVNGLFRKTMGIVNLLTT